MWAGLVWAGVRRCGCADGCSTAVACISTISPPPRCLTAQYITTPPLGSLGTLATSPLGCASHSRHRCDRARPTPFPLPRLSAALDVHIAGGASVVSEGGGCVCGLAVRSERRRRRKPRGRGWRGDEGVGVDCSRLGGLVRESAYCGCRVEVAWRFLILLRPCLTA